MKQLGAAAARRKKNEYKLLQQQSATKNNETNVWSLHAGIVHHKRRKYALPGNVECQDEGSRNVSKRVQGHKQLVLGLWVTVSCRMVKTPVNVSCVFLDLQSPGAVKDHLLPPGSQTAAISCMRPSQSCCKQLRPSFE
eukprot:1153946-Pelagomonas_calceolata.AAC.5